MRGLSRNRPCEFALVFRTSGDVYTIGSQSRACKVHPRVCGEHPIPPAAGRRAAGSSPRVRGTPKTTLRLLRLFRFIPACAGNTSRARPPRPRPPVHPRVCGEHSVDPGRSGESGGSSPRVRGTPRVGVGGVGDRRFIPACAGNTLRVTTRFWPNNGSSPRVRGTPDRRGRLAQPAAVHPRVCGEHGGPRHPSGRGDGSSPRVRGTLVASQAKPTRPRFIPACAGNTTSPTMRLKQETVHPRVCGEHDGRRTSERRGGRFIPACAGNTDW